MTAGDACGFPRRLTANSFSEALLRSSPGVLRAPSRYRERSPRSRPPIFVLGQVSGQGCPEIVDNLDAGSDHVPSYGTPQLETSSIPCSLSLHSSHFPYACRCWCLAAKTTGSTLASKPITAQIPDSVGSPHRINPSFYPQLADLEDSNVS